MNVNRDLGDITLSDLLIDMWRSESRHDIRKQVRDFIANLTLVAEHDPDSTFIYRGESECHDGVSSGLYRQFHELDDEFFDIKEAQNRQLEKARAYAKDEYDPDKILAQIQHRGGKTNLIDFTSDLNVALFFACNYSQDKAGRVIFFKWQQWDDYSIRPATQPSNMADAQKSYFVAPAKGYIREEDITVCEIPSELKAGILQHLRNVYGIEPSTVYNDISGFIRDQNQDRFPDFEADASAGRRSEVAGDWDKAIEYYTRCLDNSDIWFEDGIVNSLYLRRGVAHFNAGNLSDALDDLEIFDVGSWEGKLELPEQIRNWFDEVKPTEVEGLRALRRAEDSENHCIWVEAQDLDGNPMFGARYKLLSEDSYEYSQEIQNERVQVAIPGECHGSQCFFWFNMEGYRGVNPVQVRLGDSFTATLKPKKSNPDAPEVTIQVTYEITEAT